MKVYLAHAKGRRLLARYTKILSTQKLPKCQKTDLDDIPTSANGMVLEAMQYSGSPRLWTHPPPQTHIHTHIATYPLRYKHTMLKSIEDREILGTYFANITGFWISSTAPARSDLLVVEMQEVCKGWDLNFFVSFQVLEAQQSTAHAGTELWERKRYTKDEIT